MNINKAQQAAINDEVSAKQARDTAKEIVEYRRPVTRARIEDILEQHKANELNLLEC